MKIRITTAPPLPAAYGLTVGSEHEARINPARGQEPAWYVTVKHGNTAPPVGVMSYEAEEITEEPDYEDEEDQSAPLPVLQAENATGMVEGRSGDHNPLDVQLLPAQPARQATEDAERLISLFPYLPDEDGKWLRDTLLGWLQIMVARGEKLGYIFAADEQPIIDALEKMQL